MHRPPRVAHREPGHVSPTRRDAADDPCPGTMGKVELPHRLGLMNVAVTEPAEEDLEDDVLGAGLTAELGLWSAREGGWRRRQRRLGVFMDARDMGFVRLGRQSTGWSRLEPEGVNTRPKARNNSWRNAILWRPSSSSSPD